MFAFGGDKVGRDAAELCGWPEPTGVLATDDVAALLATGADACVYNPLWPDLHHLVALLEAGIDVCTSAAWITGGKQPPADLDRIRAACEAGGSTIFGSGAHPGMTNMVGMVLSGACERVDEVRITESEDCSTYESAGTQSAMGFGRPLDTPGLEESVRVESEVFAESAAMVADAMEVVLDRLTFDVTFTEATGHSDLGFMEIPEGTVGGVMGCHRGWVGDRNLVSVGCNWTMGSHVVPPKPLAHGHVVQVFGVPNMRTVLHCLPPADWTEEGFMGLGMIYTAMPVVNALPYVVAASPRLPASSRSPTCRRSPVASTDVGAPPGRHTSCSRGRPARMTYPAVRRRRPARSR